MPVTQDKIRDQILEFFSNTFPIVRQRSVGMDEKLMENGIIDSLGFLEIVSFIERSYEFKVQDEDVTADNFNTISNIVAYIERMLSIQNT